MSGNQCQQIIPLDSVIEDFEKHLQSHPRTILSARYGDGKSFFLASAEKKLENKYVFLKIYPVSYQVAENQDIFEYIKRDILFQMYGQGMVPDTYEIPDGIAAYYFLRNNWQKFAEEILKELALFDASNALKATLGASKFLKAMKKKYDAFKKNGGEIDAMLDKFMDEFDKKGIYEADPVTVIICDIIREWKYQHGEQQVCLVFEDMDRIDPAHIFRILNVISAHMDYGYKYGESPSIGSLSGNKFGVDNIVVCLDYDNLKHIFHHFYGQKACFDGYINKFSDKGIFRYSLQEQVKQYYSDGLARITGMDPQAVMVILDNFDLTTYTLRQLYHAADGIERQITLPTQNPEITPHRGLYIMAAIFRRLGLGTSEIISILSNAFKHKPAIIGTYVVTSMMLRRNSRNAVNEIYMGEIEQGYYAIYEVTGIHPDGQVSLSRHLYSGGNPSSNLCKPEDEMSFILQYVNK